MARMSYSQAACAALARAMRSDPRVVALGEDVGRGGIFQQYKGLQQEFGARRVIDTPISEATILGAGCRVGNGAFVSHNVRVGPNSLIGHGSVIAGSCSLGSAVTVGPGVTVSDRIVIGDGARLTLGGTVTRDVPAYGHVSGNFAIDHRRYKRFIESIR